MSYLALRNFECSQTIIKTEKIIKDHHCLEADLSSWLEISEHTEKYHQTRLMGTVDPIEVRNPIQLHNRVIYLSASFGLSLVWDLKVYSKKPTEIEEHLLLLSCSCSDLKGSL